MYLMLLIPELYEMKSDIYVYRKFETEVVAMTANMLHGDSKVVGSLTSGGTESILMAVKTYRDRARALFPNIKKPEMVSVKAQMWLMSLLILYV